jgi:exodeoxyribonuclease V alpha subunit
MSTATQLTGTIQRITFHTEETGYCVLKVVPDELTLQTVTLVGRAPRVIIGERFAAMGSWIQDPVHGKQFRANELKLSAPESTASLEKYLGSGLIEGIGPAYAKRLIAKFGSDVLHIIENESAQLERVEGIGSKRRKEIRESWLKQKSLHEIMLFLSKQGISTARALRIYKTYGENALSVLRSDPYRLAIDIRGIGFKTADAIARYAGLATDAVARLRAGLRHCLETAAREGHCYMQRPTLLQATAQLLNGVEATALEQELEHMLRAEELKLAGQDRVYLPYLRHAELSIAANLRELLQQPAALPHVEADVEIQRVEQTTQKVLAPSQRECVRQALQSRVLIITGGPGVGKTTILNTVLKILQHHGVRITLAAPTGRAAKRMSESTQMQAMTLHRLLEYEGEGQWGRNRNRRLAGDFFVLDECSMIDVTLMAQFLSALPHGAHLLLVGDAEQLPSVGPGRVLADLIHSEKIPCVRLREIFRQAADSRIIISAHAINQGLLPDLQPQRESDFFFLEENDAEQLSRTLVRLVKERLPTKYSFDPKVDIQVLSPMHRNSLGTHALNKALQAALNPPHERKDELDRFGHTFRVGDKVLQTHNNYEKDVFNGDLGFIQEMQTEPLKVIVKFEGNRLVHYEPGELDELTLAYAMSIHKSQGSEFPCVILPLSTQHYILLERSLLYTAVTRAKKLVVMIGDKKALSLAIQKQRSVSRSTGLVEALSPLL